MANLTPEFFNMLILLVIAVGLVLAALRFYRDMTRPLPREYTDADYVAYLHQQATEAANREGQGDS